MSHLGKGRLGWFVLQNKRYYFAVKLFDRVFQLLMSKKWDYMGNFIAKMNTYFVQLGVNNLNATLDSRLLIRNEALNYLWPCHKTCCDITP